MEQGVVEHSLQVIIHLRQLLLQVMQYNDGNDRIITSDGDGTATAESNLVFDGTTLHWTGN